MTQESPRLQSSPENETALESWKEIAAYLKRDVRTVRRWEANEGLPVHRHLHQARSTVYAYASELDAWWAKRRPAEEVIPAWYERRPARILAVAAMVALLLISAGSGLAPGPATAAQGPAIVAKRIWSGPGVDNLGGPSPDGHYLSFVDWSTGDLAVRDLSTGQNRRLTNKGTWSDSNEFAEFSVFSPDGQQIAYAWDNEKFYDLRVVGMDGSKPQVIYSNPDVGYLQPVAWTPGQKQILTIFWRKDRTSQIAMVNVADGGARVLRSFDWRWPNVRLSPDGRYIAYDFPPKEAAYERDIFLLPADGSREIPLVEDPAHDFLLGWAPDGSQIVFGSDRTGNISAWALPVQDGKPQGEPVLVRNDLGRVFPMSFSSTGAFYYSLIGMFDVSVAELDSAAGRFVAPPQNATHRFQGRNGAPAWSPDGKYLCFLSRRGPAVGPGSGTVIVIRTVGTGEERELTPQLQLIPESGWRMGPVWTPDGKSLLVLGRNPKGRWELTRLDAQTGAATVVLSVPPENSVNAFDLFPDGKSLLLRRFGGGNPLRSLNIYDLATGKERVLHQARQVDTWALSPDGRQVALASVSEGGDKSQQPRVPNANSLLILPTDGGTPREILHLPPDRAITAVAWTPDQKYLLLDIRVGPDDYPATPNWHTWRISAAGGQPEELELALKPRGLKSLRFHPDGRHVVFSVSQEGTTEVWMMENFLPASKASK